jgi:hypothetical protein
MMIMLSLCTQDMNKYVSMFPDVWFIDCTAGELISYFFLWWPFFSTITLFLTQTLFKGTNRQKEQLFVIAVRTANGTTLPGNLTIIPSEQKWVFYSIYRLAFSYLYSAKVCLRNRVVITDKDDAEY